MHQNAIAIQWRVQAKRIVAYPQDYGMSREQVRGLARKLAERLSPRDAPQEPPREPAYAG